MGTVANTKEIAVSVIIPVFNAAEYLTECLESILTQRLDDIEVICVNDCSTDDSARIVERGISRDSRIKLYQTAENSGAPVARNLGVDKSVGEYILFVDADDLLMPNSLDELYRKAKVCNSDAIKGTMYVSEKGRTLQPHHLNQTKQDFNTTLLKCDEICHMYQYQSYLFRSSIIKEEQIRFGENLRNFQDPVFLSYLLPACGRIDITLQSFYIRRIAQNSIITSDWKLANFISLTNGVDEAYCHLIRTNNSKAAQSISKSFAHWWYKLAQMPSTLEREECMEIFRRINAFSKRLEGHICERKWGQILEYQILSLISEGYFDDAYARLAIAKKLDAHIPKPLIRFIDICLFLGSHLHFGKNGSKKAAAVSEKI